MILDQLAESTAKRVGKAMERISLNEIKAKALALAKESKGSQSFPFEEALKQPGIHFICEVKKASPSKGIIAEDFPYTEIAKQYEKAGAACISVLTEPEYFMGSSKYLEEIQREVGIPILRKDFTISPYQIYEAKVIGASAVLLICALLDTDTIRKYINLSDSLGLSALVEAHNEEEIKSAIEAGARIIGVNNRNLKDFTVDINNSLRLRTLVPDHILFIAESGIKTSMDIKALRQGNVNGVLIGEALMKCPDKKKMLDELRGNGGSHDKG